LFLGLLVIITSLLIFRKERFWVFLTTLLKEDVRNRKVVVAMTIIGITILALVNILAVPVANLLLKDVEWITIGIHTAACVYMMEVVVAWNRKVVVAMTIIGITILVHANIQEVPVVILLPKVVG